MKTPSILLSLALALASVAQAKVTEKFTQTYPLDANGSIHLENINGSVEIIGWDKAEVALEAEKTASDQEGLDRMHLQIDSSPRRLRVKTEYEKKWKFWETMNAQVHYKLMVPAGAALDKVDVVNANIHVSGVRGEITLETVNGGIEAEGLTGPGRYATVNGSVRVAYTTMPAFGSITLRTVNGSCKLTLPAGAAFDLDTDTVNGRVNCDFPIALEKSDKRELHGAVNGGGTRVKLDSVNGGLSVLRSK
ncbi:MAG: hypothetical protein RL091_3352 [Verrucomicrobiota bacterium]|jgi:DUF4097 and DUF4098 domain-containing protein YvlB